MTWMETTIVLVGVVAVIGVGYAIVGLRFDLAEARRQIKDRDNYINTLRRECEQVHRPTKPSRPTRPRPRTKR